MQGSDVSDVEGVEPAKLVQKGGSGDLALHKPTPSEEGFAEVTQEHAWTCPRQHDGGLLGRFGVSLAFVTKITLLEVFL